MLCKRKAELFRVAHGSRGRRFWLACLVSTIFKFPPATCNLTSLRYLSVFTLLDKIRIATLRIIIFNLSIFGALVRRPINKPYTCTYYGVTD
jgi:hypothetical protein